MDTSKEIYKTKDINEASYIYSQGVELIDLEPESYFKWFVFSNPKKAKELSKKYWSRKAVGNIKDFADSLKTMKDLVHSRKEVF